MFWCGSRTYKDDKRKDKMTKGIIIGDGVKNKANKKVNVQGQVKGKLVNDQDKGKGKIENAEQEDKPQCPWVLYISKGEKGK